MGCLTSPTFFFFFFFVGGNEPIWLAHCKNKLKLQRLPWNRRFHWKMDSPFGPSISWEGEDFGGKTYRIKQGATWNTLGEHIGNLKGTYREQRKNEKKSSPTPSTQNLKEKKSRHLECMLPPTQWLHVFFISETVRHHFGPGLIPPLQTGGTFCFFFFEPCKTLFISTPQIQKNVLFLVCFGIGTRIRPWNWPLVRFRIESRITTKKEKKRKRNP